MSKFMEPIFSIIYLITVISIGLLMILKSKDEKQRRLFGVMTFILGFGDAFHLVPRMYSLLTDTMEKNASALGFGKFITSITMTVFYVLLYHFWCNRYKKFTKSLLSCVIYGLSICRIALCFFPQNDWLSADAPFVWGIYRNIPFTILGAIIVILFFKETKKSKDKYFRFAWIAVSLSFLFYIPVVIWADSIPVIGMLMIPKTVCYVWLVIMGYRVKD